MKGLDVGTSFLIAASNDAEGNVTFRESRDAFLGIENKKENIGLLNRLNIPFIERDKQLMILGAKAINVANILKTNARRPLHKGIISNIDPDARDMLEQIIPSVLDRPSEEGELCTYTIPSPPIDEEMDIEYHKMIINGILTRIGYNPVAVNEARCIVMSELQDDQFTGLGISMGAGMANFCLTQYGIEQPELQFSIATAGDFIDKNAARNVVGMTATKIQKIKEKGIDIRISNYQPESTGTRHKLEADAKNAISIYYQFVIRNGIKLLQQRLSSISLPEFDDPIKIVIAGGTSQAIGFHEICRDAIMNEDLPLEIAEVIFAKDPLYCVAKGALIAAALHGED